MYNEPMSDASCKFFVEGYEAISAVGSVVLLCTRPHGGSPTWTLEVTGTAGARAASAQRATRESAGWGRELVGLILIDISFPIDGEAAGVEYAHTASGWLGRRFDIIEDGTVVAVFDGPVAPVVERIVLARPCTMPHTAAA